MEMKIISDFSPGKEIKCKILIFIPVSESKYLITVRNNFISLRLDASEYMNTKVIFCKFCLVLKMPMGKAHYIQLPRSLF